ncbi:hypothetical protein TREAZ_2358 [Leadbettera azotonutricia ZAS-9]|uniref:Uncharacterized protein n=1 Tax=Leadbettera azotonutricia (strain ATCC BAA-888 / DSM 13862 / ZAS-9) TaxID=545695 RepID=F5YGF9_LEAAZ|nr:hypothetical protein TREAZ_2358 [Leadbettera azotonutricia ZAS-9]
MICIINGFLFAMNCIDKNPVKAKLSSCIGGWERLPCIPYSGKH